MPFVSDSQRKFMYAKHPRIAKRWSKHTPKGKKLPEKKESKMDKKACVAKFLSKVASSNPAALKSMCVESFCNAVYEGLAIRGISKEAFTNTKLANRLVKLAAVKGVASSMDNIVNMLGLGTRNGQILAGLSTLAPFTAGSLAGAGAVKTVSPYNIIPGGGQSTPISNLQKEDILARYDSALAEGRARMATRKARAT